MQLKRIFFRSLLCIFTFLAFMISESLAGQDENTTAKAISLKAAVKIALAENPDNQMALTRIKQAEAMISQANAAFYPRIGAYVEYLQGDAPSSYLFKRIDQRKLPVEVNFNDPGWFENFETGIRAQFNLYNAGRDVINKQMAETNLAISRLDRQDIVNSLIASVIHAYYQCLSAKEYIKISQDSVATVKDQLRVMKIRFSAGDALKSDILSLEVRLAQAMEDVVQSKSNFEISLTALAHILGISPDEPIVLSEADSEFVDFPENYEAGITYALNHRPELLKVKQQVKQSKAVLDMSKADYLPRVDLQTVYYFDDPQMRYHMDRENWMTAIVLSWDIFSGLSTSAAEKKAVAVIEETLAADRKTISGIKLDVKIAFLKLSEAKERIKVAQARVADAETCLELVKLQYEGGSATITRYLEAELDRNKAEIDATTAFYDRQKAYAEIGRAIGYWGRDIITRHDETK
ncbi:MAG: TolC family protein [Desulfobacterales bacterium]|nr:TolC family protein [Desulfobacterales bacterium]